MSIIDKLKADYFTLDLLKTVNPGLKMEFGIVLLYYALLLSQIFLIFMFGACLCGFFQCMIYRIEKKINLLIPRSFCEFCGETIKFIDAVPFLNYLLLKGKSRCCKKKLPGKYFLSEILSGVAMLILFLSPGSLFITIPFAIIIIFIMAYIFYPSIKLN